MAQTPTTSEVNRVAAMPRCRDCKWWEPPTGVGDPSQGMCLRLIPEDRKRSRGGHPRAGMAEATGQATIITAPDFGCVQFEVRG